MRMTVRTSPRPIEGGASPSSEGDNDALQDAHDTVPVSDSDITYEDPAYTVEENLVLMDEVVEMDGFTYQIIDFEVTKEFGDRNRETFVDYLDDVTDADNNLTGDQSYVFVTLSIQNNTDKEVEAMRAPGVVVGIDSDWEVIPLSADPVYIEELWTGGEEAMGYFYKFQPGESVTCESGYLVNDADLKVPGRTLTYEIKNTDDYADLENKFIQLEN